MLIWIQTVPYVLAIGTRAPFLINRRDGLGYGNGCKAACGIFQAICGNLKHSRQQGTKTRIGFAHCKTDRGTLW